MEEMETVGHGAGDDNPMTLDRWREALPGDIAEDPSLADIRDVASLAKGYVHAQRMVGRDKIAVPREGETAQWEAVYNRLGRPEAPDGYELPEPEGLPEQVQPSEEWAGHFKQFAHENGLNTNQASAVWNFVHRLAADGINGSVEEQKRWAAEREAENRAEWGLDYDRRHKLARQAALRFGDREVEKMVAKNPVLARVFAKVGERVGEDSLGRGESHPVMTPDEARSKINKIIGNFKHPYHDSSHPGHEDAVNEVARLHTHAFPNETA
ncbi:MAG: hypothetical protein ACLFOY_14710 [Desulfatibacillaceae bacterium]